MEGCLKITEESTDLKSALPGRLQKLPSLGHRSNFTQSPSAPSASQCAREAASRTSRLQTCKLCEHMTTEPVDTAVLD